jgi:sugar-specific transcriptional regulator TrmB
MIASSKVMDALKGIGLNLYERRLWVALLARGTSTAGELSEIANVPRSRTYDILQSLADKGFVVVQTSKPIKYVAVAPEESLERVKKRLEEDVKSVQSRIDELKNSSIMSELREIYKKGMKITSPQDLTGALKGKYSVSQQMSSMFREASKSIHIITNSDGLEELALNHFEALRKAKERGVDIRIATNTAKLSSNIKPFTNIAEIRNINKKELQMGGKFFIVDNKEMLFPLTDPKEVHSTQNMAIWSKSDYAASNLLSPLFDMAWSHGKALK